MARLSMGSLVALASALFFSSILFMSALQKTEWRSSHNSSPGTSLTSTHRDNLLDVTNKTLGFQELLVISLPARSDKRDVWALAAAATDIDITYVDGVKGEDMPEKAIPAGWDPNENMATLGCFRGHMNTIQHMVENRIQSALIFEDDADWDIMLKQQLIEFARGARFLQDVQNPSTLHSPYGDDWDMLWIGHCGIKSRPDRNGRYYAAKDDPTVIPPQLRREQKTNRWVITTPEELQGNNTRIVFENKDTRCAYAYALSLRGADRFLYEFSVRPNAKTFDRALSRFCDLDQATGTRCVGAFPALIDNYQAAGSAGKNSDRRQFDKTLWRKQGESPYIVFPVKSGLETFVMRDDFWRSQTPDQTMLKEIDPNKYQLPRGKELFFSSSDFDPPPGY